MLSGKMANAMPKWGIALDIGKIIITNITTTKLRQTTRRGNQLLHIIPYYVPTIGLQSITATT